MGSTVFMTVIHVGHAATSTNVFYNDLLLKGHLYYNAAISLS